MAGPGLAGTRGDETDEFASRLRELKANGSATLVVGSGAKEEHVALCRKFLGDDTAGARHRLLVFTNGTFAIDERIPNGLGAHDTRVITASTTRSTSISASETADVNIINLGDVSLGDIGVAIVEGAKAIEQRHGPLEPTELRVGIDSLAPLLDAYSERAVFHFLVLATTIFHRFDALGHVHLPVDRTAYMARLLAPLFNAVVEVRVRGDDTQQRWSLDGGAVTSSWIPL